MPDGRTRGVEFSDTGHGIPGEHLGKIFEPFFSTKGNRDGTGLGLSISDRIIQNHGGRIEVESEGRPRFAFPCRPADPQIFDGQGVEP